MCIRDSTGVYLCDVLNGKVAYRICGVDDYRDTVERYACFGQTVCFFIVFKREAEQETDLNPSPPPKKMCIRDSLYPVAQRCGIFEIQIL